MDTPRTRRVQRTQRRGRAFLTRLECLGVLCTLGVLGVFSTSSSAQFRRPRAELTPLAEGSAKAGAAVRLALKVVLPEGLHTQSNKPRDPNLIPTELTIDAPAGVTVDEIVWPKPTDFKVEGLDDLLAVFEHESIVGVQLTLASSVPNGTLKVPAHFKYQACDSKACYAPTTADFEWTLTVAAAAAADPANAATFKGIPFGSGSRGSQGSGGSQGSQGSQGSEGSRGSRGSEGSRGSQGSVELLDGFEIRGTAGGYLGSADFLTFIKNAEAGIKERGMFEGRGPLAILLLVLIGGLALNLTPCVLPMIPINLAIIGAGAQASSRWRGFLLGSAYGAAMAVVYGTLGLVVILTAGTFGTINSSPWFNLGIALLFVILGLAMFDVLLIDFSKYSSNFNGPGGRGSVVLAFSMGAVAALLAGACVAPVVIQVVLFSSNLYSTGTKIALSLPFFLGVGMAIPWPIAGAGLASLPKPGMWMVRVKQAFGVFILATALYYGWQSYSLFANRWVDPASVNASVEEALKSGWHSSLAQGLEVAKRENKPVLIDLWATWCKNCLTMDKTTLANSDVQNALSGYVKIKYQAEDPDTEPAKSIMQKFSAPGLPAYAIVKIRN